MIVFSNTTPFIALASVGRLDLLPTLFGEIRVADIVARECAAGGPILVPSLAQFSWVRIMDSANCVPPANLLDLDQGEKLTLALAQRDQADLVIVDEKMGRSLAELLGLRVTGTLGVLLRARQQNLISSFRQTAEAMRKQGIHYNPSLIDRLAARVGE